MVRMNYSQIPLPLPQTQTFQFHSPLRSYLKTNEVRVRKQLHQDSVAKLTSMIQSQRKANSRTIRVTTLNNRRSSTYNSQQIDKNQQLWDNLKCKIEGQGLDLDLMRELLNDILKEQNYINNEKYKFPLNNKSEFTNFKHNLLLVLLHEQYLWKYLIKIETLRFSILPNQTTMAQDLFGFQGINKIISKLLINLDLDITMSVILQKYAYLQVKPILMDIATHLIQPQDDNLKLFKKIRQFSDENQLNHVHFTNFKYTLYKILIELKVKYRTIKKVMKCIDYFKSGVMRCDRLKDIISANQQFYLYQMIPNKKNFDLMKRNIEILLQYITNNYQRYIKKADIKLLQIENNQHQIVNVIQLIDANQLLKDDFQQDIGSCFNQKFVLNEHFIDKFSKYLSQVPFYNTIYKDNEINANYLIKLELDFMLNNRTYFRQKEIQLIHKRFNITNEIFDTYIHKIVETMHGVPTKAIINRINQYRHWIVIDNQ